ncbi:MAG: T9SS type A sorting domain-containing protein [Ignavibacteriales bacterium]|nr:T9SS type A sorting domain-containing protein [Ignavibacteriales bacterium]
MKLNKILIILFLLTGIIFPQKTDKVILVIIDGARYSETLGDSLARFIPKMKAISEVGTIIDTMLNDGATVTRYAIPAIWCGSWATPRDTFYNGGNTQYTIVPSIWEYYRKHYNVDMYQTFYAIKNLSTPWLQSFHSEYGPSFWPYYYLQGTKDMDVWNAARLKLIQYKPVLSVIYLADVDAAGHSGNWTTYTNAIILADSIVGLLWDFVQSDTNFKDKTTIMITNDHGRHLDGVSSGFQGHGCGCWGCRRVMFLATGKGIQEGVVTDKKHSIIDIAPTISEMLNFPTPYSDGISASEIFETASSYGYERNEIYKFYLEQNYPNPFNPSTVISYQLPVGSLVQIKIFNMLGQEIATMVNEERPAGTHKVEFNAINLSSGLYFYQIQYQDKTETRKMMLLK